VKVRCKSAWLLHVAAALPIRLALQLDNTTVWIGCRGSHAARPGAARQPRPLIPLLFDGNRDGNDGRQVDRGKGPQGQPESILVSRQPWECKASVLCISLWMIPANRLVSGLHICGRAMLWKSG
jgi:hypothetical protein